MLARHMPGKGETGQPGGRLPLALLSSGVRLRPEARASFHAELEEAAILRLRVFSWLLLLLHVGLIVHDLTLTPAAAGTPDRRWQEHLLWMHVAILGASGAALLGLRFLPARRGKALTAYLMTVFLLVWGGVLSGVDQLIGAGVTVYLIVNLGSALFVTFERWPTVIAFGSGIAAFVGGQLVFVRSDSLAFSQVVNGVNLAVVSFFFSRLLYSAKAKDFSQRQTIAEQHAELLAAHETLAAERTKSEKLLRSALPSRIVERLQRGEVRIADAHPSLIIVWADLCDFTQLATTLAPDGLVDLLDDLFCRFDEVVQLHGLEKIKTVGDGYLAVAGITEGRPGDPVAAANAALDLHRAVAQTSERRGRRLSLRVGIARGEAMAGVVGRDRLLYDLWGDAVNVASRLETAARPGETLVTTEVADHLLDTHELGPSVSLELKGKGPTAVRTVLGRRETSVACR
jgi:class 3 adenylate cyclase